MINTEVYKFVSDTLFNTPDILFNKNDSIDTIVNSYLQLTSIKGFEDNHSYLGICKCKKFLNRLNIMIYKTYAPIVDVKSIDTFTMDDDITLIIVVPHDYSKLNDIQIIALVYNVYKVIYKYLTKLCTVEGGLQHKIFNNYSTSILAIDTIYDVCEYKDIKKLVGLLSNNECPAKLINDAIKSSEYTGGENIININILETGLIEKLYQEMLEHVVNDDEHIQQILNEESKDE